MRVVVVLLNQFVLFGKKSHLGYIISEVLLHFDPIGAIFYETGAKIHFTLQPSAITTETGHRNGSVQTKQGHPYIFFFHFTMLFIDVA